MGDISDRIIEENYRPRLENIVVIDTAKLIRLMQKEVLSDALCHRFVSLMVSGDGFDATDLVFDAMRLQSQENKILRDKVIEMTQKLPSTYKPFP